MPPSEETLSRGRTMPALTFVIPAYDEAPRLPAGVQRIHDAIGAGAIDPETTEFIVVDDGSTDDTASHAARLFGGFPHVTVVRLSENRGKGGAVRAGVAAASAPLIIFADADMAIDPAQTPQFVRALDTFELAIGSRAASGASVNRPSIHRSVMNRTFNRFVNMVTRLSLDDTQCGFKAFRAPAAKLLFHYSVIDRFAFDVEILSLARRFGLPLTQIPVQWLRVRGSRVRPSIDIGSMARDVFRAGRGSASPPPVPALVVKGPDERVGGPGRPQSLELLGRELSATLPVMLRSDSELLVLCPLMTAAQIEATAALITDRSDEFVLEPTEVTVDQLCALAPLSLTWADGQRSPVAP
ncbi:MAG TPA: glycosyltransferase [Acidimicrobiales bacterium]|jgi:hypothetical protein